jgi:hypothetical protein
LRLKGLAPGADILGLKGLAPGAELNNINEIAPGATIIKEKFSKFINDIKFDKTFSKSPNYKCRKKVYYCQS